MDLDKEYDDRLKATLTMRLGRTPLPHELVNADNDSDLVNEVLWQLLVEISKQVNTVEATAASAAALLNI